MRRFGSAPPLEEQQKSEWQSNAKAYRNSLDSARAQSAAPLSTTYVSKRGDTTEDDDGPEIVISDEALNKWRAFIDEQMKEFSFYEELMSKGSITNKVKARPNPNRPMVYVNADLSKPEDVTYGKIVFKNNQTYVGDLERWYFHGRGRYRWNDGTVYEGEFQYNHMHGKGKMTFSDWTVYEGEFENGIRKGMGTFTQSQGPTYTGEWDRGLPHGHGTVWYTGEDKESTDYYKGYWFEGNRQGFGVRVYPSGDKYIGDWVEGQRHGEGTMIWHADRQVYTGEWKNNVPEGKGRHIWYKHRDKDFYPFRHAYQGDFGFGTRHGIGQMIYPNGSIYEGRWKMGQRQGKGMFVNAVGEVLMGLFRSGSIVGGGDVSLLTPVYDFNFEGLLRWLNLSPEIGVSFDESENDRLQIITMRYLHLLKRCYKRAGQFAYFWGNHGQPVPHQPGEKIQKRSLPPDNVCPVTRLGLWLLLKDCSGVLDAYLMSQADKLWMGTPSISFQTRHNPFESVFFWQFIQCLIIVALMEKMAATPSSTDATNTAPAISNVYRQFLVDRLFPLLRSKPGKNLPKVPNPLTSMEILFDTFTSIENREYISATEYLHSILSNQNPEDLGTKIRPPLYLKKNKGRVETFMELIEGDNEDDITEEPFYTSQMSADESDTLIRRYEFRDSVADDPLSGFDVRDHILESNPFGSVDLSSEPFLWMDNIHHSQLPNRQNPKLIKHVTKKDVIEVWKDIYPRFNYNADNPIFTMNFYDWLWTYGSCAKISADREWNSRKASISKKKM